MERMVVTLQVLRLGARQLGFLQLTVWVSLQEMMRALLGKRVLRGLGRPALRWSQTRASSTVAGTAAPAHQVREPTLVAQPSPILQITTRHHPSFRSSPSKQIPPALHCHGV